MGIQVVAYGLVDLLEECGVAPPSILIKIEMSNATDACRLARFIQQSFPHLVTAEKFQMRGEFAMNGLEFAITVRKEKTHG